MANHKDAKERPILFSGEMVRAILDGRKTQTRRVVKPQPEEYQTECFFYKNEVYPDSAAMESHLFHNVYGGSKFPYGGVYSDGSADKLWVREMWNLFRGYCDSEGYLDDWDIWEGEIPKQKPVSDNTRKWSVWYRAEPVWENYDETEFRWRPAIHMPRWASRLTLEVVSVRVERVQDISEDDAVAEGFLPKTIPWNHNGRIVQMDIGSPRVVFSQNWDFNAERGYAWESNPWVWVIEFKKVE